MACVINKVTACARLIFASVRVFWFWIWSMTSFNVSVFHFILSRILSSSNWTLLTSTPASDAFRWTGTSNIVIIWGPFALIFLPVNDSFLVSLAYLNSQYFAAMYMNSDNNSFGEVQFCGNCLNIVGFLYDKRGKWRLCSGRDTLTCCCTTTGAESLILQSFEELQYKKHLGSSLWQPVSWRSRGSLKQLNAWRIPGLLAGFKCRPAGFVRRASATSSILSSERVELFRSVSVMSRFMPWQGIWIPLLVLGVQPGRLITSSIMSSPVHIQRCFRTSFDLSRQKLW